MARPIIFVVDDDEMLCDVSVEMLRTNDYDAVGLNGGKEFFDQLKLVIPDLVLMDVMMPDENGISVLKRFKANEQYKDIPVMFITGFSNYDDAVKSFELGAVDYIRKPYNRNELLARVGTHLQLKNAKKILMQKNNQLQEANQQLQHLKELLSTNTPNEVLKESWSSVYRGEFHLKEAKVFRAYVFIDLVGFTKFSENRPPEEITPALNEVLGPVTDLIYECGGDVNNFIGDCIFAVFSDCNDCYLFANRLKGYSHLQEHFPISVGISYGEAVRCNVGSKKRSGYTYIGADVNLAQRLQDLAEPGEVLCTARFADELVDMSNLKSPREVELKGFEKTISCFSI
jgi:DNA-binding response OmpR family regulator